MPSTRYWVEPITTIPKPFWNRNTDNIPKITGRKRSLRHRAFYSMLGSTKSFKTFPTIRYFWCAVWSAHAAIYDHPDGRRTAFLCQLSIHNGLIVPQRAARLEFSYPLAPGLDDIRNTGGILWKNHGSVWNHHPTASQKSVIFKETYCIKNFIEDYNSYKGKCLLAVTSNRIS